MKTSKPCHSLNSSLNALRISNLEDEFVTVSPTSGVGDYSSIYDALDAGHTNIFVKAGTYTETHDLVLSGQNLIGEDPLNTVIELGDNSIEIETYTAASAYHAATAQVTAGLATVSGVGGTAWDTGANAPSGFSEPWLIMRGMALPIEVIHNDTTLELEEIYRGDTQTGDYFIIDAANIGSRFQNFTVRHEPTVGTPCIKVSGINSIVENIILRGSRLTTSYGIQTAVTADSVAHGAIIKNNQIISCSIGIELKNAHSCQVRNNVFEQQNDHCIRTNTDDHDCYGNLIEGNHCIGCSNAVVELDTGSVGTRIVNNRFEYCRGAAFTIDDCDHVLIENNYFNGVTTADTVTMTNNCQYCSISNNYSEPGDWQLDCSECSIENNMLSDGSVYITGDRNKANSNTLSAGQIIITGDHCIVNNNVLESAPADYGIRLNGDQCVANGNLVEDADTSGIGLDGTGNHICNGNNIRSPGSAGIDCLAPECSVSGNRVEDAGTYGIDTDTTANKCIMTGNVISTVGSVGIRHQGEGGVIGENNIESASGHGIQIVSAGAGQGDEVLVRGNRIITANVGIYFDSNAGAGKIDGNLVQNTTLAGIQITAVGAHNFSVNGNTVVSPGTTAIHIDNGGRYSTISNNVIKTPTNHGIFLGSGIGGLHCSVVGNTIETAGMSGIFLDREGQVAGDRNDRCIISNNNVYDSVGDGILCETERCIISGNRCDFGSSDGICVRNGDQTIVDSNGCNGNNANGISIEATADRIIITSNIALNNGANQILNNGTNTVQANNIVA